MGVGSKANASQAPGADGRAPVKSHSLELPDNQGSVSQGRRGSEIPPHKATQLTAGEADEA